MMGNCVGEYGSSSMGGCGGGDGVGGGGSSGRGGHMFAWFCVAECGSVVVVGFAGDVWLGHLLKVQVQRVQGRPIGWYFGIGTLPIGCGPPGSHPRPVVFLPIPITPVFSFVSHHTALYRSRLQKGRWWGYDRLDGSLFSWSFNTRTVGG